MVSSLQKLEKELKEKVVKIDCEGMGNEYGSVDCSMDEFKGVPLADINKALATFREEVDVELHNAEQRILSKEYRYGELRKRLIG